MQDKFLRPLIPYCLKAINPFLATIDLFCKRLLHATKKKMLPRFGMLFPNEPKVLKIHLFF